MSSAGSFRRTQLDRASFPAWRDGMLAADASGAAQPGPPRRYPGYPVHPLPRVRPRLWPPLDRALRQRRCARSLGTALPSAKVLSRLLFAHTITGDLGQGPTPSSGGLQSLELYLAVLTPGGWLPHGWFHFDRAGHHLARLPAEVTREEVMAEVPSLELLPGGALLWVLVGDGARVTAKYGERGLRFLLLEAGHLMQSLCLLSASLGLTTVPLGGFFESALARRLQLLATDEVLYVGLCGPAES